MIPPVDVPALFISAIGEIRRFHVHGREYNIPTGEIWNSVNSEGEKQEDPDTFTEGEKYTIRVDGWWLYDKDLYQTFRGLTPFKVDEDGG